jgi:hypothetical protein
MLRVSAAAGARLTFGSDFLASGAGTYGLSPPVQIEVGKKADLAGLHLMFRNNAGQSAVPDWSFLVDSGH